MKNVRDASERVKDRRQGHRRWSSCRDSVDVTEPTSLIAQAPVDVDKTKTAFICAPITGLDLEAIATLSVDVPNAADERLNWTADY